MKRVGLLLLLALLAGGCKSDEGLGERPITPVQALERSLYESLNKEEGISRIVDEWLARTLNNPRVNFSRGGTNRQWAASDQKVAHLKAMMVQLLCERSGGPIRYAGRDMTSVHQGMQIRGGEFDAMKKDLKDTLKMLKVKEKDTIELLKVLETVRKDIVEVP